MATDATDTAGGCMSSRAGCADDEVELTLYRGATVASPIDGMYSFAPALVADLSITVLLTPAHAKPPTPRRPADTPAQAKSYSPAHAPGHRLERVRR